MSVAQFDVALDRPLPQNPEAERAILGSILTNPHNFWNICTIICAEDFFKDAHRHIWRAIVAICEEGRTDLDTLTLKHDLANNKALDQAGGSAYISSLVDGIPDVTNVVHYARIVKEKSDLRRILVASNGAMRRALDETNSASIIATETAAILQGVAVRHQHASRPVVDVVNDVDVRVRQRIAEGRSRAILTGFKQCDLDRVIRRKALTLVAAPTSHGKSTLLLNFATGAVTHDAKVRATLYSLEMSDEDMAEPILSHMSGVFLTRIQERERMNEDDNQRLAEAMRDLAQLRDRFYFADRLRDVDSLIADCMQRKATGGLDAIFIDYLQLVRGYDERSREQEVDRIGRALLLLAQDLDIAVVAGSQVNKEREKRASGRLSVQDLKYGAVIGEHARVVLMFQRPRQDDKSNQDIPWCSTTFQIEKNSGRQTGDVPMHADMPKQTFAEGDCEANACRRLQSKRPSTAELPFGG